MNNVSEIVETVKELLQENEKNEKIAYFRPTLKLLDDEFYELIQKIKSISQNVEHEYDWYYGLDDNEIIRDDIFYFDTEKEKKKIVIEARGIHNKYYVRFVKLRRYPK